jgi:hypothetical protein
MIPLSQYTVPTVTKHVEAVYLRVQINARPVLMVGI